MSPRDENILLTGASGYIGFKTLKIALEKGYNIRAVVRQDRNASDLEGKSELIAKARHNGRLEWAVIPDFLAKGAISQALKGVTVVVHLASPLAIETEDFERDIIQPAEKVLTVVLEAAANIETIRRVVITSSCVTLIPFEWNFAPDSDKLYTPDDINSNPSKPFKSPMEAYWASKAYARIATRAFVEAQKPQFDFVNLLPSVVIGPDERLPVTASAKDLIQGARGTVMGSLLGPEHVSLFPYVGTPVHVADVARAHVDAIDSVQVSGNAEYILSSDTPEGVIWDEDAQAIAKKHFMSAVESGKLPLQGSLPAIRWRLDAAQTENAFGWKFTTFEDTMKGLIDQYLQLQSLMPRLKAKLQTTVS